ncbi:MAG: GH116 family glycosyl-hydrolase, partial [Candidatus Omnitrophota bacterium]|nr:GH116 family glycosyl-hydrolase [Candidatus Omnitrophota bacterium]
MYSISGAFGPWAMEVTEYEQHWLSEGAFHVYEKAADKPARVKCLTANPGVKNAWEKIGFGDGAYYALQPKGWVTYYSFDTDVSQKFFSPIIAHNYKETSYPVAVWQWKVS